MVVKYMSNMLQGSKIYAKHVAG